jgi:carboxypeptidase Taq
MNKISKAKTGAGGKKAPNRRSAESRLTELKTRLLQISDLVAAGNLLGWDHATYMPRGGASARARQGATLSRIAHEKSSDPALGKLLAELAPYAYGLPHDGDEASLIRIARRDFEKACRLPSEYVARASALGSASYDAWTRARPANDFAAMRPFLEKAVDISREYADFFAPYEHVADPLIDAAEEGMTAQSIRSLFAGHRNELLPIAHAILTSRSRMTAVCAVLSARTLSSTSVWRWSSGSATTQIAGGSTKPIIRSAQNSPRGMSA